MPTPTEHTVAEYFAGLRAMDTERCVALFAPEAIQIDPVGTPPNVGTEAIRGFFDTIFTSFKLLSLTEASVHALGTSAAIKWTGRAEGPTGKSVEFQGVDVLDCDEAGKIISVRAFWDTTPVMAVLES